jgi:hypothetical protein
MVVGMTNLAAIRDLVRKDLHDTDDSAYRWDDAQLDRHIGHALDDLSLHAPRQLSATMTTTAGSRDLSLSEFEGLIEVERVEFPAGFYPPCTVGFQRWGDTLSLQVERLPAGEDARLVYTGRHTLDATSSTVPAELESTLAMGAAAFAVLERAAFTPEQLNTGGDTVPGQLFAWAKAREVAFRQLLLAHGRSRRVRQAALSRPW